MVSKGKSEGWGVPIYTRRIEEEGVSEGIRRDVGLGRSGNGGRSEKTRGARCRSEKMGGKTGYSVVDKMTEPTLSKEQTTILLQAPQRKVSRTSAHRRPSTLHCLFLSPTS